MRKGCGDVKSGPVGPRRFLVDSQLNVPLFLFVAEFGFFVASIVVTILGVLGLPHSDRLLVFFLTIFVHVTELKDKRASMGDNFINLQLWSTVTVSDTVYEKPAHVKPGSVDMWFFQIKRLALDSLLVKYIYVNETQTP